MIKRFATIALLALAALNAGLTDAGGLGASVSPQTPATVIEFYNANLDHYFITADPAEATALDTGVHQGWMRTGAQFTAYTTTSGGDELMPVCRFYGRPEAGLDSHFYSGAPDECVAVFNKFASSWTLESGSVFRTLMPDRTTGACASGVAVYRLFNNRRDANHRYTADLRIKDAMVARGYTSEGYGPNGVAMCAVAAPTTPIVPPAGAILPMASILVTQVTPDTFDFSSIAIASTGAAISGYVWNFGDGATLTGSTASHTFTASGTFPVVLTVTDSMGAVATATKSVTATVTAASPTPTPTPPPVPAPAPAPSSTFVKVPPAASATNSNGTWTIGPSNAILLNGASTSGAGTVIELIGDTIFVLGTDNNWYQWFGGKWVIIGTVDPAVSATTVPAAYVGPSNTPDIWGLELTDYNTITARAGYPLKGYDGSVAWAYNPEFGVDAYGIKYLRFSNNPAALNTTDGSGSKLLAWFMPLGGAVGVEREKVNVRYLLWIEDDVAPAFNELGMKLPGPASDTGFGQTGGLVSWRTWHAPPVANTYVLKDYLYDAESGSSYPTPRDFNVTMRTNRWYSIEVRAELNTIGLANGYGAVWVDGNKVYESSTILFRDDPLTKLRTFFVNVYHGGMTAPKGMMHYRIAKLAVSSSYIGVPTELLGSSVAPAPGNPAPAVTPPPVVAPPVPIVPGQYPAWRQGKGKDAFFAIPNTAQMAGNMQLQVIGTNGSRNVGKAPQDINAWSGFAHDDTSWWGVALGGHADQWSNKVFKVDFSADQPQFVMQYAGSPWSQVPSLTDMFNNTWSYYYDGLPAARHVYYGNHYVKKLNRVMMSYASAVWSASGFSQPTVNGFRTTDLQYDPAGTWPNLARFGPGTMLVPTMAKHPVTEDIYYSNSDGFQKWSSDTGAWSILSVGSPNQWLYHGSVIDSGRNRWVYCAGGNLEFLDLSSGAYSMLPVSGDANFASDAAQPLSALIHDLDNDRYLLFVGNSNATPPAPGRVYAINPASGAATKIADIPAAFNGVIARATYFQALGGVAYLPEYNSNILFMPTR